MAFYPQATHVGMTARARTLARMRALGFYARWPMYADRLTFAAGVISVASDEIADRPLTFGATHRPVYETSDPARPCAVFAGNEGGLDAGGLLDGLAAVSWFTVLKDTADYADYGTILIYSADSLGLAGATGTGILYKTIASGKYNHYWDNTPKDNQRQPTAPLDSTAFHVYVDRMKASDGINSVKTTRRDGSDLADTHVIANDSTGTSFGAGFKLALGTAHSSFGATSYPGKFRLCDLAIGPYLSDADADAIQVLLKAEWGTP